MGASQFLDVQLPVLLESDTRWLDRVRWDCAHAGGSGRLLVLLASGVAPCWTRAGNGFVLIYLRLGVRFYVERTPPLFL